MMHGKWIRQVESNTCIVFVHGILSNSQKCWTHSNGTHWPAMAAGDPQLSQLSIYDFSYKTGFLSGDYGVGDAVDSLTENCDLDGVFYAENIIFVCHSLGGIVVRKFLVEQEIRLESTSIGLFLIGSPSYGSEKASRIKAAFRSLGNMQAEVLLPIANNLWLQDLDKNFKSLCHRMGERLWGKELTEDSRTGVFGKVVAHNSAALYFSNPFKVPDADHSSIAKPSSTDCIQHRLLKSFVSKREVVKASDTPNNFDSLDGRNGDPLFEIYSKVHDPYYVLRPTDQRFRKVVTGSSVWLHGPPGSGKTSAVRRYLAHYESSSVEVSLNAPAAEKTGHVLREIGETISILNGVDCSSNPSAAEVADLILSSRKGVTLVVFFDEVPTNNELAPNEAVDTIAALVDAVKRRGRGDVRFIACSLHRPSPSSQRLHEQMTLLELNSWSESEVEELIDVIQRSDSRCALGGVDRIRLIAEASGSPRFVKQFFRELLRNYDLADPKGLAFTNTQLLLGNG